MNGLMMRNLLVTSVLFCGVLCLVGEGCRKPGVVVPSGMLIARGTVQFEGVPLSEGEIGFKSETVEVPGKPNREYIAAVMDGKFQILLPPGKHRVEIRRFGPQKLESNLPPPQLIPDKYNKNSVLTAEVQASGDNSFLFQLDKAVK